MSSSSGWKIEKRATACAGCEASFAPGTAVTSALYEEEGEFLRRDWCPGCAADEGRTGAPYSFWTAEIPEPEARKAAFDLGVAREFLGRLLQQRDPERDSLRYLLALLLLRKRVVRVLEQFETDAGERMTFTVPPDETVHEIPCPEIDEDEAAALREQLGRLFDLG